jgi:hypothetical protein
MSHSLRVLWRPVVKLGGGGHGESKEDGGSRKWPRRKGRGGNLAVSCAGSMLAAEVGELRNQKLQ